MSRKNTLPTRVDPLFKKFIDDIRLERVRLGKDKWPKSPARLTLAITRVRTDKFDLKKFLEEARIDD